MIAVCPLTTAGAPSQEAKEPAIAHIPKPTAPMPASSFSPLVIMTALQKSSGGGCMIDGQTSEDAPPGARACFHPLPFAFAKPNGVASYRFSSTIGTVL